MPEEHYEYLVLPVNFRERGGTHEQRQHMQDVMDSLGGEGWDIFQVEANAFAATLYAKRKRAHVAETEKR